jgi:cell shape-determining protein MreC
MHAPVHLFAYSLRFQSPKVRLWFVGCILCVALASVSFLDNNSQHRANSFISETKEVFFHLLNPVRQTLSNVFQSFDEKSQKFFQIQNALENNALLHQQIIALKNENLRAEQVFAENKILRELLHVEGSALPPPQAVLPVYATLYSTSKNSLVVGTSESTSINKNQAVIVDGILLGRTNAPALGIVRITHVFDASSRIPVRGLNSGAEAILAGNGTNMLTFLHRPVNAVFTPGETLVTSSAGGVYWANIPVGTVVETAPREQSVKSLLPETMPKWVQVLPRLQIPSTDQ